MLQNLTGWHPAIGEFFRKVKRKLDGQVHTPVIPVVILVLATLLIACSGNSPTTSENNEHNTTIHVEAQDFSFSLEASQMVAGKVTFMIDNDGSVHHDFAIRGNGMEHRTPMIEPGESATLTADLEPGINSYICSVPGHEQLGMSGTLIVISK